MSQPQPIREQSPAEVYRVNARSLTSKMFVLILVGILFAVFTSIAGSIVLLAIAGLAITSAVICGVGSAILYAMADASDAAQRRSDVDEVLERSDVRPADATVDEEVRRRHE